jgi:hypothetical protein
MRLIKILGLLIIGALLPWIVGFLWWVWNARCTPFGPMWGC